MIGLMLGLVTGAIIFGNSCKTKWADDTQRFNSRDNGDLWYIDSRGRYKLVSNNHPCVINKYEPMFDVHRQRVLPFFPDAQAGDSMLIDLTLNRAVYNYTAQRRIAKQAEEEYQEMYTKALEQTRRARWKCPEPTVECIGEFPEYKKEEDPRWRPRRGRAEALQIYKKELLPKYAQGKKYRDLKTGDIYYKLEVTCDIGNKTVNCTYYSDLYLNYIRLSDDMLMDYEMTKHIEFYETVARNNCESRWRKAFEYGYDPRFLIRSV